VFSDLHELLAHYARTAPGRNAILAPGATALTYGGLQGRANETLRALRGLGISRSDRVAVVLPNGSEAAVAITAVATAATCVPLNPALTADELQRYFSDLQLAALLTRADMGSPSRTIAQALGIAVIDLIPSPGEGIGAFKLLGSETRGAREAEPAAGSDNDAFVLLTSGTAARPKLVPLTHRNVCRSAHNAGAVLQLGPKDRLLSVLPLFHAHGLISGLLTAFAAGSSVVCIPAFEPDAFFDRIIEFQPTWYTAVPVIHRAVLAVAARRKENLRRSSLRVIRSASASLPPNVLRELEALFGVPVIETYGMTEAASQIAANSLALRKPGSVGRSAGAEIAITDRKGRRLAAGKRGEVVLRGPTITRGYDGDIAATKSAFCDGWFRTGDLGYLDPDGYLFIVGRIKDVINRGGQKIAPAEVEEALSSHRDVLEAVAFSIPHRRLGEDLAAAAVLRPDAKLTVSELQKFAGERLASFKIPRIIRIVREIPKSSGGKIRRSELAAALSERPSDVRPRRRGKPVSPRSELEHRLAGAWAELLELDQIGIDQDVFALGADSLIATQMLSRLRMQFGIEATFNDIFDARTVAALAARIDPLEERPEPAPLGLRDTTLEACGAPLSFQQQRIGVLSRLDPLGCNYNIAEVIRLSGPLDVEALQTSVATICERQEVLRSIFPNRLGEPVQLVGSAKPRIECIAMHPCAKSARAAAIRSHVREWVRQPFDFENIPPLLIRLLRLGKNDHAFVIKLHHLITDGWSQRLLWKELEALYAAALNGVPSALPELEFQYRHFANWQRDWLATPAAEAQRSYWRTQLAGTMELSLPTDRPRFGMRTGRGARERFRLSRTLSRGIRSLSRAHGVTTFMTLLAGFQCLLSRYTRQDDIAIGSVIANRNRLEFEHLMGMFANTIVLRTDLSGDPNFTEVLHRVRQVTLGAYRNQDLPFEEVLRSLELPRAMDRNALSQVMFILQNPPPPTPTLPGLSAQLVDVDPELARADLMLELLDTEETLHGWFEYSTDLFEPATIRRMAGHLKSLLQAAVADPGERVSCLPLLTAEERTQILLDWNDTRTSFGRHIGLWERFAGHAERTPDAIAVSTGRVRLSYRELAHVSAALADRISMHGVGPDVVVALLAERGPHLLAGMMAVQRAGGAFLVLDPTIPAVRLARIIRDSRTPLVLTEDGGTGVIETVLAEIPVRRRPRVLTLAKVAQIPRRRPIAARQAPSDLAYAIYTSGSTGTPKGAMVEQRGLLNHLLFKISDLGLSHSDVIAQTAPQSFDISVWQFLTALLVGGRVHVFSDQEVRDASLLAQAIGREGVTVLQIVPTVLRAIFERMPDPSIVYALRRLRWLICIGEALAPDLARNWLRHFPDVALINAYGPAECSDTVAMHRLTASEMLDTVPVGRPVANARLYVLDGHLQPAPIGVTGELCVGGICVGRGYLNNPEQTRQSFVCDPFSRRRARLYRTGDLARWRSNGVLEFVGRVDHQVKIRGCRIELGEIERVLSQHPQTKAVVVLARDGPDGDSGLIAYIVAASRGEPDINELRQFLKSRLPEYMIPKGFVFLDRIPLSAHGKIDRAALAALRGGVKIAGNAFVAPRNSIEDAVARIWADLLKIEQVGVFDNFFELGGHSLIAGRVLARIADAFDVSLSLRAIFEAPTVAGLAALVHTACGTQSGTAKIEIPRVKDKSPQPVSIMQEEMLRIEGELPDLPQFNLPFAFRLRGPLDVRAFERSLVEVVRRHDSLRTGFVRRNGQPVAVIAPPTRLERFFVLEDLSARAPTKNTRARALLLKMAELRAEQAAGAPFDTRQAPLLRARLLRLGAEDHVFVLVLHHIVVDGWSIGVFMEELSELYAGFAAGGEARLPEPALQFSDFARWQAEWRSGAAAARQLAYWHEQLRGASPVFSFEEGTECALLTSDVSHAPVHLSKDMVARLNALSASEGTTPFMTLLAAFKTLLLAKTGRKDICIATAMANRSQPGTERVIGPLVNTTVIRTRMDAEMSFRDALGRVRVAVVEAYARQELPFQMLAEHLTEKGGLDPEALTQVYFVLQSAFRPLELPDITIGPFAYPDGQRILPIDRTWLALSLKETAWGIIGSLSYKPDLFGRDPPHRWIGEYAAILAKATANTEAALGPLADL
jgi:amino acid adenylation domain-containing protein